MAYLINNGDIESKDPNNPDVPEVENIERYLNSMENFVKRLKRYATSPLNSDLDYSQIPYDLTHGTTDTMLLTHLNVYLSRINNFYDYKPTRQQPTPITVYNNILRGEMKTIWDSKIKVKQYEKIFNITNPKGLNSISPSYFKQSYQDRSLEYQQFVQTIHNNVSALYKLRNDFYKLVADINKKGVARSIPLTTDDCINFSSNENFNMLNPHSFVQYYSTTNVSSNNVKIYINGEVSTYLKDKPAYMEKIDFGGRFNVDRTKNIIIDNKWFGPFFKHLNDDLKSEKDLFARFALYVGILLEKFPSLFTNYNGNDHKADIKKFSGELASIMERYIAVVRRIIYRPTNEEEVLVPNTVFKKSNYLEAINKNPVNGNFYKEVTTTRGKPANLESIIREVNKKFGLRLHDLVSLNPLINGKHVIPIFGCDTSNTDYSIGDPIYDPERKIVDGTENNVYSLLNPFVISLQGDNYRISTGTILGSYKNGGFELNEKNKTPGNFLNACRYMLDNPTETSSKHAAVGKQPYTYAYRRTTSGEVFESKHMSLIGFAELFIDGVMSFEDISSISFLRYEVLSRELLLPLNKYYGTNFPYGTKFLYIDIRHDGVPRHGVVGNNEIPPFKITSTAANYTDVFTKGSNTLSRKSSYSDHIYQQDSNTKYQIFTDLARSVDGYRGRELVGEEPISKLCDFLLLAFLVFVSECPFKLKLRSNIRDAFIEEDLLEYLVRPIWDDLAFQASRAEGNNVNILNVF